MKALSQHGHYHAIWKKVNIKWWWLSGKETACQCRRCRFEPWVRRILWRGNGNPLQYSCLGNPMDREAWQAIVHGVAKSQRRLSD